MAIKTTYNVKLQKHVFIKIRKEKRKTNKKKKARDEERIKKRGELRLWETIKMI